MKWNAQRSGLSARRGITQKIDKKVFIIMRPVTRAVFLGAFAVVSILISSCDKKTNGQDHATAQSNHTTVSKDSLNKPKVSVKVNRRYDEKGNVIGFDSTYSSYYSNVKGDTATMDSLMHRFDRYFNFNHSSLWDRQFNTLFFNDSARYPDFFHDDFFMKRYELNDQYFRGMMNRMDSIKNHFFKEESRKRADSKDL